MMSHKFAFACAALILGVLPAAAQTVPKERGEVASSGGQITGVSLVKIADGFNDPVGVASAFDGDRPTVRRRACRQGQDCWERRQGPGSAVYRPDHDQSAWE